MKKIKSVFVVRRDIQMATRDVLPESQWVLNGEGTATIKYDGTPVLIDDKKLYMRWNRKLKPVFFKKWVRRKEQFQLNNIITEDMFVDLPDGAIRLESGPANITLHYPFWVPVIGDNKHEKRFVDAFNALDDKANGTYELIGKDVQGNPYNLNETKLVKHGSEVIAITDLSFNGIKDYFSTLNHEGIVWYHPDGRMAKLRRSHFNFDWKEDARLNSEDRANFIP